MWNLCFCLFSQGWEMNTSGRRALIWLTRVIFSGWPTDDRLHSLTGTLANRTISDMKTVKKRTAWNCGIVTARGLSGTIHHVVSRRSSYAKCNDEETVCSISFNRCLKPCKNSVYTMNFETFLISILFHKIN